MNRTTIVLIVLLLAVLGYTISAELDHRKELDIKNTTIEKQQTQIQKWQKLRLHIEALKEEHNVFRKQLNVARAAALACQEATDNTTIEESSHPSAELDATKPALP